MSNHPGLPVLPSLDALERVINEVVAPAAVEIDRTAAFPRAAVDALGHAGLMVLVSSLKKA